MGVEELQLFFQFSNISGLFPFRMVLDQSTGRFKCFEGHWYHLVNWWFIFLLIGQIFYVIVFLYMNGTMIFIDDRLLPVVYLVAFSSYLLGLLISTIIPRFFLIHFRHLESAFIIFQRIDNQLIPHRPATTQRRTFIAIFLTLLTVNLNLFIIIIHIGDLT